VAETGLGRSGAPVIGRFIKKYWAQDWFSAALQLEPDEALTPLLPPSQLLEQIAVILNFITVTLPHFAGILNFYHI